MGFLGDLVGKAVKGVGTFIKNAKVGKMVQAGGSIKFGDQTDKNKAAGAFWKSIPVAVYVGIGAVVLLFIGLLGFRRKR